MSTSTNRLDESVSDEEDVNENEFIEGELKSELTSLVDLNPEVIIPSNELAAQTAQELESELSRFRSEWKEELYSSKSSHLPRFGVGARFYERKDSTNKKQVVETGVLKPPRAKPADTVAAVAKQEIAYQQPENDEEKARYLFSKGVMLEQQGRYTEAIQFYKMSMQLDPDIEFKVDSGQPKTTKPSSQPVSTPSSQPQEKPASVSKPKEVEEAASEKTTQITIEPSKAEDDQANLDTDADVDSLFKQFQLMTLVERKFCEKNTPQSTAHFSDLPMEVIMLIFKWAVSDHLDMRSLENLARVCKGFYVCARDQEIWRLACNRIWRDDASCVNNYNKNWREMYLKRPHLNHEGVYISKASYAREGEKSLDNFYRPWHLVEYYRYMRFFSNGTMLFLTTPEEPKQIVAKLKKPAGPGPNVMPTSGTINTNDSILKGNWTINDNKVNISLLRKVYKMPETRTGRRHANKEAILDQEHVFRIEMELSSSSERKLFNQLAWSNYEVCVLNRISNTKNTTSFDLNKIDFPNFFFSRVKSYTAQSEHPLK